MEASVRLFNSSHFVNRTLRLQHHRFPKLFSNSNLTIPFTPESIQFPFLHPVNRDGRLICTRHSAFLSVPKSSNPLKFPCSLSLLQKFSFLSRADQFNFSVGNERQQIFATNQSTDGSCVGFCGEKEPDLTVVLLGWLGAEVRHLKRYADLYSSRGIRSVSFVVSVKDILGFDLGRRVEERIAALTEELIEWLSDTEKDGRERGLLFHTFSNTGWFAYGAILDNLQQRGNFMKKIKGCVIDSGADPEINPQVWAAGFSAALLKKHSSLVYSSTEAMKGSPLNGGEEGSLNVQESKPTRLEMMFLAVLEKFFSSFLKLPDVNRRLIKVLSILSNKQPPCPQLYLYSTADRVVPFRSVERFIQKQKKSGRKLWAYNFVSSPHVDHFRNFPHIYSEQLDQFLEECIPKATRI